MAPQGRLAGLLVVLVRLPVEPATSVVRSELALVELALGLAPAARLGQLVVLLVFVLVAMGPYDIPPYGYLNIISFLYL